MRTEPVLATVRLDEPRSSWRLRRPGCLVRLSARLRAHGLDIELASGIASWRSPVHAARALQLTSGHSRRGLASSLERLLEQAQLPTARFYRSAVVPPCREAVSPQLPQILALVTRLRSGEPVAAEGIARLRLLLSDGAGPVYTRGHPDALAPALDRVARCLEVAD
jgi:hypothetical protein